MNTELLERGAQDATLSFRARGILLYLAAQNGDAVPSIRALAEATTEGRDAVATAINELIDKGYIDRSVYQTTSGSWRKMSTLSQYWKSARDDSQGGGFSGDLSISRDVVLVTNKVKRTKVLFTADTVRVGVEEPMTPEFDDEATGAIGKIFDEPPVAVPKERRSGYITRKKRTVTDNRATRDVDAWTAQDFVREFSDRSFNSGRTWQVDPAAMRGMFANLRRNGVTGAEIHSSISLFFADPRNLNDAGEGFPLWKRYANWYKHHQKTVAQSVGVEKSALDSLAEQILNSGSVINNKWF
jgi:hypothetical protein